MANIYRTHPERNLEDRISEVIHHTIDPGKLPTGSIIQTKYLRRTQDRMVTAASWHGIDELPFTPLLGTSLLRLSINYSIGAQAGNALYLRFTETSNVPSSVELERTGIHRVGNESLDAYPTRMQWMHYHHPRDTLPRTYRLEGYRHSGSGIIWVHTYGSATSSFFTIEEIKQ
jgi:hypothetical protein